MASSDTQSFEEAYIITFATQTTRINAYTFASAIVGIADAAKAANAIVNPGYEVEVLVDAISPGSFKATIRTVYRGARNLFSAQRLEAIGLSAIAAVVYQYTLAPDPVSVTISGDDVVIEQDNIRLIVPRNTHDAIRQVEKSDPFWSGVQKLSQAVLADSHIESVQIQDEKDPEPAPKIPRERFSLVMTREVAPEEDERDMHEDAELRITRAILEPSARRWEFVWRGFKISAPITDPTFHSRFAQREFAIAPGDILEAKLLIRQRRDPSTNVFVNSSYEVTEVIAHRPRPAQENL